MRYAKRLTTLTLASNSGDSAELAELFKRAVRRFFVVTGRKEGSLLMVKFLLWCLLFILCWPLALIALVAYPFVWLLLLPFRIVGIAVGGALELVAAIIFLPGRLLKAI